MKLDTYRIDSRDIEKIDDPTNIINPEYKLVRWYAVNKKVHYVDIKKLGDGEFIVNIVYKDK